MPFSWLVNGGPILNTYVGPGMILQGKHPFCGAIEGNVGNSAPRINPKLLGEVCGPSRSSTDGSS